MYEATDFLIYGRRPDPSAALIVWQIGAVGDLAWNPGRTNAENVRVLVDALALTYGHDHVVVVYEAAQLPTCLPTILHLRLGDLPLAPLSTAVVATSSSPISSPMLFLCTSSSSTIRSCLSRRSRKL